MKFDDLSVNDEICDFNEGIRTTMKCPEQLLFDRYFGDCNYAQLVICEPKNAICEQFRALDWLGAIKIGNPLDCSRLIIILVYVNEWLQTFFNFS